MPPPYEPQPWALAKLSKYAARIAQLLHDLTDVRAVEEEHVSMHGAEQDVVIHVGPMPKSAVAHSEALAFIFRHKAGALLSYGHERCLVVARVVGEDGRDVGWSAPLFCRGRTLGLGLSAGWMEMRVCWAIEGQGNLRDLLRPQSLAGVNAAFLVDMNGARMRPLRRITGSLINSAKGGLVAKYWTSQACMVDFAVRAGTFRQDVQVNRALYGPDASSREILGGRTPRPPEFAPVYALLAQLQQAAGPVMPRSSSQLRHLSPAGQGRANASRPPSRQGSGSGSGRSRSAFAAAGGAAAEQPSPRPPPSGSANDGSPPLPAQNGKAPGALAPSAPGSPQPLSARSTSPGRPPLHPRSPRPPRSESPQPAAPSAAAEAQLIARGRTTASGDHSGRSADSSPESPGSGVHAVPF